ncbi:hypothetical protein ASG11_14340 [Sphingomonas sp. Leaf357]|uniref:sugar kinase n=1 Tax=Sphingomonas sp. Leaf357 TaxID=1736350 RepID=UPI0006FEA475|nr:sugar kinase [Sphingomonas sp. Leaf357]KQS01987.1 hypothetical protein ASG11_14340 [Sphingomonas sp. Leaf357]
MTDDTICPPRRAAHVVCFGEMLVRLATQAQDELAFATALDLHVGGAEANVAAALAWLGHRADMITALPSDALGDRALTHLRARGVGIGHVRREEGRMGLYFAATGASLRPTTILYDRAASVFAATDWSETDWSVALAGADLLHVSGISLAVGQASADAVLAAVATARAMGVLVSFDGNFRPQLWRDREEDPAVLLRAVLGQADIFFGDHRDAALILGTRFDDDAARAGAAADAVFAAFPQLRLIASTTRRAETVERNLLSARIDSRSRVVATPIQAVEGIVDRIGAGDAFAAGVLHALLTGETIDRAAADGLALTCLKHSQRGDAASVDRVRLAAFSSGEVDLRR